MKKRIASLTDSLPILWGLPFFIALLAPYLIFFAHNGFFAYTNAWDEETYLTYPGAWAALTLPGYTLSGAVVLLLHRLGLSGGVQNLLFDLALPTAILWFLNRGMKWLGISRRERAFYAVVMVFGAVLFDQANPLLGALQEWRIPHLLLAQQGNTPLLRSPHPQWGYLLLTACGLLCLKVRRVWPLLFLFPLMYWAIVIPLAYLVLVGLLYSTPWIRSPHRVAKLNLIALGITALGAQSARWVIPILHPNIPAHLVNPSSDARISVLLVFSLVCLGVLKWCTTPSQHQRSASEILVTLCSCQVFYSNFSLISGVRLEPIVLEDTSGVIFASAALVCLFYGTGVLRSQDRRVFWIQNAVIAGLALLWFPSQGFELKRLRFRVYVDLPLASESLQALREDPLHAIFVETSTAAKMALAYPRMPIPVLGYQYGFSFIGRACPYNRSLQERAIRFIEKDVPEPLTVYREGLVRTARRQLEELVALGAPDSGSLPVYCIRENYELDSFYWMKVDPTRPVWAVWPNWPKP